MAPSRLSHMSTCEYPRSQTRPWDQYSHLPLRVPRCLYNRTPNLRISKNLRRRRIIPSCADSPSYPYPRIPSDIRERRPILPQLAKTKGPASRFPWKAEEKFARYTEFHFDRFSFKGLRDPRASLQRCIADGVCDRYGYPTHLSHRAFRESMVSAI